MQCEQQVSYRLISACYWAVFLLLATGCDHMPMGIPIPQFDAESSSKLAVEQYDANGDGLLSVEELVSCTALAEHLERHDADKDGQLSAQEIADRIRSWVDLGAGVMSVPCRVTLDGRPLSRAEVVFQPVAFLGNAINPARGITNTNGQCNPSIDPAVMPAELSRMRGVQPGLYQVLVTHKIVKIPARYQEPSILSIEVAEGTISPNGHEIKLRQKLKRGGG